MKKFPTGVVLASASSLLLAPSLPSAASLVAEVDEVIVTGTRTTDMLAGESLAPVAVLDGSDLAREGRTDLGSVLGNLLPSLNVQAVGFDLANETLAVRMRGLSPNHTLVLVNGKRLHGTANLAVLAGPFQGGAAPDLNFIALPAVERIEVLTDGAAAQYGSDAIAGVVNIRLRTAAAGGKAAISQGAYFRGDGRTREGSLDFGLPLGGGGFLNVTALVRDHDFSNAGGPDQRVERAIASGAHPEWRRLAEYPRVNKVFGDARYRIHLATLNGELPVDGLGEFYLFGSQGMKRAGGWANFRLPTRLPELYPAGFTPIDWVDSRDSTLTAGLRSDWGTWAVDLSATHGSNRNRVEVTGSANIDLFRDTGATPVDFHNGNLDARQSVLNLDVRRPFDWGGAGPGTLAVGIEHRRERYAIAAGDSGSRYKAGSQSFPGFSLSDAGSTSRNVAAAYVDAAFSPTDRLQLDVAGRSEHYSDFGRTVVGKLSARRELDDRRALRLTVSSGFRAPTLAETRYSATNVQPNSAFVQLPPNAAAARLIGIDPLEPEHSTNLSLGFVGRSAGALKYSLDLYQITVRDRIFGSGTLYGTYAGKVLSAAVNAAIVANGNILEAVPFSGVNVFTNGVDTRTRGADLVMSWNGAVGAGHLDASLGANVNRTRVVKVQPTPPALAAAGQGLFDAVALSTLESASPKFKATLSATYVQDMFSMRLRNTFFGQSSRFADPGDGRYYLDRTGAKVITDLDLSWQVTPKVTASVGANNLFNVFPERVNAAGLAASAAAGNPAVEIYPAFSPFGINGGYWFARLETVF